MLARREATRSIIEKARIVQEVMHPGLQRCAGLDELGDWAMAMAVYAGVVLGFIHQRTGRPIADDQVAADMVAKNALGGMRTGRAGSIKGLD